MLLIINGKKKSFREGLRVSELLEEDHVEMPQYVTVQVNGTILKREQYPEWVLRDGDEVEFLYYMGGGGWS